MNQLFAKLKEPFAKEVLLAMVLFCLPFLMWAHVFVSDETITTFYISGTKYDHGYGDDQVFAWSMLSHFITIVFLVFFFQLSKERFRYIVLFLIAWFVFQAIEEFFYGFREFSRSFRHFISAITACSALFWLLKKNKISRSIVSFEKTRLLSNKELRYSLILLVASFFCTISKTVPGLDTEVYSFGFFKMESYGFIDVEAFLWAMSFKVAIVLPMMVWFLTEKKWWKYALLSPILITTYQIWTIFSPASDTMDEYEIFQVLPLLGLLTIVLIALSKNAKDQYLFKAIYNSTYTKAEKTVKKRFKKKQLELDKAKEALESYKEKSNEASLAELKALKERLEKKLSR